jgi:hypothetical protein
VQHAPRQGSGLGARSDRAALSSAAVSSRRRDRWRRRWS